MSRHLLSPIPISIPPIMFLLTYNQLDPMQIICTLFQPHRCPTWMTILSLSKNHFRPSTHCTLEIKGKHPSLGLNMYIDTDNDCIVLRNYIISTPDAKIRQWRSTLRHSILTTCNDNIPSSISDVHACISNQRKKGHTSVKFRVVPLGHTAIHPSTLSPQFYLG